MAPATIHAAKTQDGAPRPCIVNPDVVKTPTPIMLAITRQTSVQKP
jgi:hypothetical protein